MFTQKLKFVYFGLILFISSSSFASVRNTLGQKSFLFRITSPTSGKKALVLGTKHDQPLHTFPKNLIAQISDSKILVTEILQPEPNFASFDAMLRELNSTGQVCKLWQKLSEPERKKIISFLLEENKASPEEIEEFLAGKDLANLEISDHNLLNYLRFTALYVGADLDLENVVALNNPGVESHVWHYALETHADRQSTVLDSKKVDEVYLEGGSQEDDLKFDQKLENKLQNTLRVCDSRRDFFIAINSIFRSKELSQNYLQGRIFHEFNEDLPMPSVILRNYNWIPKIKEIIEDNGDSKILIAFGAGHLLSSHGVLKLLLDKGFTIEDFDCEGGEWLPSGCELLIDPDLTKPEHFTELVRPLLQDLLNVFSEFMPGSSEASQAAEAGVAKIPGFYGKIKTSGTKPQYTFDNDDLRSFWIDLSQKSLSWLSSDFDGVKIEADGKIFAKKRILEPLADVSLHALSDARIPFIKEFERAYEEQITPEDDSGPLVLSTSIAMLARKMNKGSTLTLTYKDPKSRTEIEETFSKFIAVLSKHRILFKKLPLLQSKLKNFATALSAFTMEDSRAIYEPMVPIFEFIADLLMDPRDLLAAKVALKALPTYTEDEHYEAIQARALIRDCSQTITELETKGFKFLLSETPEIKGVRKILRFVYEGPGE